MENKTNSSWTEGYKWRMDLLKSLILWVVGIFVTQLFISRIEEKARYINFKNETYFKLGLDNLDRFNSATAEMSIAAYDYARFDTPENKSAFQNKAYDGFKLMLDSFKPIFCKDSAILYEPKIKVAVDSLERIQTQLHQILKNRPDSIIEESDTLRSRFKSYRKYIIDEVDYKLKHIDFTESED